MIKLPRLLISNMNIDEEQLARWAKAPSETEEGKYQNTVSRIKETLFSAFGNRISVFIQGSYKNRTNVRLDSDVDIVARLDDIYFGDISGMDETDKQKYNEIPNSDYTFKQFKDDVQQILENEFEYGTIERHNKCIKVRKNEQRVDADVVPCFVHKRFSALNRVEAEGIGFLTDNDVSVNSFPEQHYDNGVSKNNDTNRMYKSAVRIIKNTRNKLIEQDEIADEDMPSFFLECLVWNVPSEKFLNKNYSGVTRVVTATVWNDMKDADKANTYAEVSGLKWLFRDHKERTHSQAQDFMQLVWDFIGYED